MPLALGLMSGTSADGITAALVKFSGRSVKVLRYQTYPYSSALRKRVMEARHLKTPELSRLNWELGEAFAQAAKKLLKGARPLVIGSHGQTVWHGPDDSPPNTLQIGEPAVIAQLMGLPVVGDFRPGDMAAGGQGAPLMPAFDEFLFAHGPLRAVLNIGGIANVTIVGQGKVWAAFDTGPGNGLMDLAVRLGTQGKLRMDSDGHLAALGRADEKLLRRMLTHPFLRRRAPKSLDITDFGLDFLRKHFGKISMSRLPDILATLSLFTARTIADSCSRWRIREMIVSGGGALNPVLMRDLWRFLDPVSLKISDDYGLPVMAKEAACFAWLGYRAWEGKTNNCPCATGAKGRKILGKLSSPI